MAQEQENMEIRRKVSWGENEIRYLNQHHFGELGDEDEEAENENFSCDSTVVDEDEERSPCMV